MRKLKNIKIWVASITVFALVGVCVTKLVMGAGTATFTLSPASGSHDKDSTFSVTITENGGSAGVGSVQADLTYDQSKLEFQGISLSGSPFANCIPADPNTASGNGLVSIVCADLGGSVTGSQKVGTVTFKVLVGSGSTSVNFAGSSHIVQASPVTDIWDGSTNGAVYTLTTPAPPPPTDNNPGTPSNPSPSSGSGSGSSSGTKKTSGSSSSGGSGSTSSGGSSSGGSTSIGTVTDTGEPIAANLVAIKVTDKSGKPIEGADVTLGKMTTKTDATGIASFVGVIADKYTVVVKTASQTIKSNITVKDGTSNGEVQQFDVKIKPAINWLLVGGVIAGLVILVVVIILLIRRSRNNPLKFGGSSDSLAPSNPDNAAAPEVTSVDSGSLNEKLNQVKVDTPKPAEVIKPNNPDDHI